MTVSSSIEPNLPAAEFLNVLVRSTLAERRPIHGADTIRKIRTPDPPPIKWQQRGNRMRRLCGFFRARRRDFLERFSQW
jgi:hypothetical protein